MVDSHLHDLEIACKQLTFYFVRKKFATQSET